VARGADAPSRDRRTVQPDHGDAALTLNQAAGLGLGPRRAALRILREVRDGRPFDAALDDAIESLPDADRRLAHEMAAGVLRQQDALDDRLARLVRLGWDSVAPALRDLLRLGAYQLLFLDRIPPHAAVSTAVELARELAGKAPSGFVNAVLRRLGREATPGPLVSSADPVATLAREHTHPEWLVAGWVARFGVDGTTALLRWNNGRPPLVLQPARQDTAALAALLASGGVSADPAPFGAGLVVEATRPGELPGYAEGAFFVQDPAQAMVARFADLPDGARVLDACAAPGGKAIALGHGASVLVAAERNRRRLARLHENLRRAGSGREHVIIADATAPPVRALDAVLLDAPCLGTGTFARHPDARLHVTPAALRELARTQAALLEGVASVVRPGGLLVYATCSLEPEENEEQVARFLDGHRDFHREATGAVPPDCLSPEGDLALLPHRHGTDGAYAARLRRSA
jgi:16S rRNA (cytosine967-C5)-methyltransferase